MTALWLRGLLRRRTARTVGTAVGVALAVTLLAALGAFLTHSRATMTSRAAQGVAVDWQVQVATGSDPTAVAAAVGQDPSVTASSTVGFAPTTGMRAATRGTTQQTGPGVVLGVDAAYRATFPAEIRDLTGRATGVLVFQQTAANLQVAPGDTVLVGRSGLPDVPVVVDGVVDLPQADSLFQNVGAPAGSQPSAPPDNVLVLPAATWTELFGPLASAHPDLVHTQVHAAVSRSLPSDPAGAYQDVVRAANNLEARTSGAAVVGDNLAAALDAARSDAAYAQILFLFLGLPGAAVAALLTGAVAASGREARRADQALLRARGASPRQLRRLIAVEALATGAAGAVTGLVVAAVIGLSAFGTAAPGSTAVSAVAWSAAAAAIGIVIAWATLAIPARRDLRGLTVRAARDSSGKTSAPGWVKYAADLAVLALGIVVVVLSGRNGYQLVLAPEGVATISVSYWALAGPAAIWIGGGLLIWHLAQVVLARGRRVLRVAVRPIAGSLSAPLTASLSRGRRQFARAVVVFALSLAFIASTATFNATYATQAEADAQLTNGADVTVTEPAGAGVGPALSDRLGSVPGVRHAEPLQHRFAYVGADVQDLYGVRPDTVGAVTSLQDAYFVGGSAAILLQRLSAQPDAILVSAETVTDYQLTVGDSLALRVGDGRTGAYHLVRFRFAGVVKEFPTAPKDSFLVANAAYVAQQTGSDAIGAVLLDTAGQQTATVAGRVRNLLGTGAVVTDIASTRSKVGSSLTSVDLSGLTRVELTFGLVLLAASAGLVLALTWRERRRSTAIARALGATRHQLARMVVAESALFGSAGVVAGVALAVGVTTVLVKALSGVFDPLPDVVTVPWAYLLGAGLTALAGVLAAVGATVRATARDDLTAWRDL